MIEFLFSPNMHIAYICGHSSSVIIYVMLKFYEDKINVKNEIGQCVQNTSIILGEYLVQFGKAHVFFQRVRKFSIQPLITLHFYSNCET